MQRYPSLSERKLRQLRIPELLDKVYRSFCLQHLKKGSYVRLLMSKIDAQQCGLFNVGRVVLRAEKFVRIHVSCCAYIGTA